MNPRFLRTARAICQCQAINVGVASMGFGRFEGNVVARWLDHRGDDRDMELLEDFIYIDPDDKQWVAPKGSVINGASIPSALWSSVGPPYVGDYRRASVVHDVACEKKTEPHEAVHLMFYYAMRAAGMGWTKANVMYQAVKRFGPTWSRAGGRVGKRRRPRAATVQAFARAVEEASREISEDEGLEAVERRADELILSPSPIEDLHDDSDPHSSPQSKRRKVSRVRRVTSASESAEHQGPVIPELGGLAPAVRKELSSTKLLSEFRTEKMSCLHCSVDQVLALEAEVLAGAESADGFSTEGQLSKSGRLKLVDQALLLLEQNYVHRPLKESMYAINPVQKLRLLREKTVETDEADLENVVSFHKELAEIFLSTRDLHTNYFLPDPFASQTAYLPFLVEDYFDEDEASHQRRFLVTRVFGGFNEPPFGKGVELLRWNGIPIERAVEINGDRFAGSNVEARRSRGIETLTVRPLVQSLPPEEDFVLIEYRTPSGDVHELRVDWLLFSPDTASLSGVADLPFDATIAQGVDIEQALVRLAKKYLFAPDAVVAAGKMARRKTATKGQGLQSLMPDVVEARSVSTESGDFGYLRIRTFGVPSADRFVDEVIRLIEQLPQEGLIIDVRGNGGGLILAGEQLLQIFTPRRIEPTLFQLRNTPLNRRLVEANGFLAPWRESMKLAVQTGATYSQGFPITSPEKANAIGQKYHGPVVLVTDGLCYSTTDIFAAGFQDHQVGTILGTDDNTGAGGANVWDHRLLRQLLAGTETPYEELPLNAGMRVSMRRTIRVGESNGTVLEDLGVVPDLPHRMTRRDLLEGNVDLLEEAGKILADHPRRQLDTSVKSITDGQAALELTTMGLDRVDFFAGDRPFGSVDVEDGTTEVSVDVDDADAIRLTGFVDDELVAARLQKLS